jgi:hypothetical protein
MMRRAICAKCIAIAAALGGVAGAQPEGGPVVAVEAFTGTVTEQVDGVPTVNAGFPRGFADLVLTEMVTAPSDCGMRIVEWMRRAEVVRENELSRSSAADPSTALPAGQLLQPDVFVRGTLNGDAQAVTWNVQLVTAEGGQVVATLSGSVRAEADDVFGVPAVLAAQIIEEVCKVEAGYTMAGVMDEATIEGTICGEADKPFAATSPEVAGTWSFVPSSPDAGSFTYTAGNVGGATGAGKGTYTVIRAGDKAVRIQLAGSGSVTTPFGTFSAPITESIALTPAKSCGRVGDR